MEDENHFICSPLSSLQAVPHTEERLENFWEVLASFLRIENATTSSILVGLVCVLLAFAGLTVSMAG